MAVEGGGSVVSGSDGGVSTALSMPEEPALAVEGGGSVVSGSDGGVSTALSMPEEPALAVEGGGSVVSGSDGGVSTALSMPEEPALAVEGGGSVVSGSDGGVSTALSMPEEPALAVEGGDTRVLSGSVGEEEGPVKFGFLNGQSGDYGPWGGWALAAAEVAVEELNAAGGVLGREVELVVEDNGSTPEGAVSGLAELTEVDGIHALGGIESGGMLAIFETVHELQIPTICSTCGTTELDATGGDMVFRIIASASDNGIVGAQMARDEGYRNVAMLVELSEGTTSPADVFKSVFTEQMGGTITEDVRFNAGEATYAAQVARAFESNPDAVYIAAGFERRGYRRADPQRVAAPGLHRRADDFHD